MSRVLKPGRVTGRVRRGKGTGWLDLTLALPVPSARVNGLQQVTQWVLNSESSSEIKQ